MIGLREQYSPNDLVVIWILKERIQIMPHKKKAEEKNPAPRVSTPRVKASSPEMSEPAAPPAAAKSTTAALKPETLKAAKAAAGTDSLLKLNGAVNGHTSSAQVAERAYFLWLDRGCPEGTADQDWVQAEIDLGVRS
jgi:hypothetical protein